jgi:hypothetical protein
MRSISDSKRRLLMCELGNTFRDMNPKNYHLFFALHPPMCAKHLIWITSESRSLSRVSSFDDCVRKLSMILEQGRKSAESIIVISFVNNSRYCSAVKLPFSHTASRTDGSELNGLVIRHGIVFIWRTVPASTTRLTECNSARYVMAL